MSGVQTQGTHKYNGRDRRHSTARRDFISSAILSMLCLVFLIWAGVVWQATQTISQTLSQMRKEDGQMQLQNAVQNVRLDTLEEDHEDLARKSELHLRKERN